jgi:hypothetical protein
MSRNKEYIGKGICAEIEASLVKLTSERVTTNGSRYQDTIYLNSSSAKSLISFIKKQKAE